MSHKHENGRCMACEEGMDAVIQKEREAIEGPGWYAHIVTDDKLCPMNFNYHTHGLMEKYNHLDLQICLSMNPNTAHAVANAVINQIAQGKQFADGDVSDEILKGYSVSFMAAWETGRDVLRIILPDREGGLSGDYAKQITLLSNQLM